MPIRFPIQTPKNYIEGRRIIKSVEQNSIRPLRKIKERRYKAYLSHSQIGFFPNGRKESLSKKLKKIFLNLKDEFKFDEFV